MRSIQAGMLTLLLACSTANARTPRSNRATGITLTVMGLANIALLAVFVPLAVSFDASEGPAGAVGVYGLIASPIVGVGLLSVGIPLWVLGQRDLDRQRAVSFTPTGLRVQF
jgi:hypothetical protein